MEKLCSGWSYPPLKRLFQYDLLVCVEQKFGRKLQSAKLLELEHRWSWVPQLSEIFEQSAKSIPHRIKEMALEKNLNLSRNQRRNLSKGMTAGVATLDRASIVENLEHKFGQRFDFLDHPDLIPALLGKKSSKNVQAAMEFEIGRPTSVVTLASRGTRMSQLAFEPIAKMQNALEQLTESLIGSLSDLNLAERPEQRAAWSTELSKMKLDIVESQLDDEPDFLRKHGFTKNLTKADINPDFAPHNCLMSQLAIGYASDHTVNPGTARRSKGSDAGDLLHILYAPHSTIWMGDRYSTDLARRAGVVGTALVSDRSELLMRLRAVLSGGCPSP